MECSVTEVINHFGKSGFNTTYLSQVQAQISHCPNLGINVTDGDFRLYANATAAIVGSHFARYGSVTIIKRLWNWKVPILQLIAQFAASPYSFWFSFLHFLGDPIDTIASLAFTLAVANKRYYDLKGRLRDRRTARSVVLIITETERVGDPRHIARPEIEIEDFAGSMADTAHSLAANLTTKFVPAFTAIILFIVAIGLSYGKLVSTGWDPNEPPHIEIHSIAISLTTVWVVPAVLLAAIVGVPQSESSTTRILRRWSGWGRNQFLLANNDGETTRDVPSLAQLISGGGFSSWRPDRWAAWLESETSSKDAHIFMRESTAALVVAIGPIGAALLSSKVPPNGINCRVYFEMASIMMYALSYLSNFVIFRLCGCQGNWGTGNGSRRLRNATMAKDTIVTVLVTTIMMLIQAGLFNSVECYRCRGTNYMCLPDDTKDDVIHGLSGPRYAGITFATLGALLALGLTIGARYYQGMFVFLQSDREADRDDYFARMNRWWARVFRTAGSKI